MNASHRVFATLLVLSLLAGASAQDAGTKAAGPGTEEKINAVLSADDPESTAERFTALFAATGESGLAELRKSPHDSIAIQAAWQEVVRTVPKTAESMDPPFRLNREKLKGFLEFLDGRTRIRVPKWWSQAILDARAYRRSNIYFDTPGFEEPIRTVTSGMIALRSGDVTVTKKGNVFSLEVGRDSIVLPAELLENVRRSDCHFGGCFTSKACYVADFQSDGHSYTLACLGRSTGKTVWKTSVWGSYWGSISGGGTRGRVAVILQENRVVVFGCGLGIHVEVFRADDGKNLFRFSNGYSWAD